jgi:hypothetical protein
MFTTKEHNKYLILLLLLLATQFFISPAVANTFGDIDAGIVNDDNLSRSDYGPDKKAGTAIEIFADYGKFFDLNNNWSATASVFSQYTNHIDFSKLSTLAYGASGSIRKKLGLGAYSSSIQASLSFQINNVADTKRNNNTIETGLNWNKKLNDTWELSTGISLDSSDAKNNVFDVNGTTFYLSTDYTFSEKLLFSFGLSQRNGDIISVSSGTNPNWTNLGLASGSNYVSDTVFGTGLTAYRVNAKTLIIKASLSYALNNDSSINVGYEQQNSSLGYGINYLNNILRVNYIYSF